MADSVSTILDYLRQHHFLQAEAALKAELAGREVSNGLFSIDVDLGVRSVQENVEKLVLGDFPDDSKPDKLKAISKSQETEVRLAGRAIQLFDLSCKEVKYSEGESRTDQTNSLGKSTGNSLQKPSERTVEEPEEALEVNKRADGTNGEMDLSEDFIKSKAGISGTQELNETFWEQKDELLWVSGPNKQGPQLGKVHPLDEPGLRSLHSEQKHKTIPAVVVKEDMDLGNTMKTKEKIELQAPPETAGRNLEAELAAMNNEDRTPTRGERTEGLPRLPPVRLKSAETIPDEWMPHCKFNTNVDVEAGALEGPYGLGAYLDVPVGQDISSSGKRSGGSNRPSVSHGIVEDPSDLLAFANVADDYPDEYWDSDDYEDDDDPGYTRRPIEDEATFLAGEVNYPSEEDRARAMEGVGQAAATYGKYEDDDRSFVESYFSGEEYYKSRETGDTAGQVDRNADFQHAKDYDGQLLDSEELKQIRAEPAWQGFVVQGSAAANKDQVVEANPGMLDLDPDDLSREIRETYLAESSGEGETQDCDIRAENCYELPGFGGVHYSQANSREGFRDPRAANTAEEEDIILQYYSRTWVENAQTTGCEQFTVSDLQLDRNGPLEPQLQDEQMSGFQFGGFSFPSPSSGGEVEGSRAESGRSLWSARDISSRGEDPDHFANGFVGPDDTLASWKRKSNDSSPIASPGEDHDIELPLSTRSTCSGRSSDVLSVEEERLDDEVAEVQREDTEAAAFDEEAIAVHEHFQRLQAEEDEFETFDLKIVHRKNRTGFEEEKDFPVVINSVIAGRYHVTEYLGSAAFSKAIQAHDLHTGMDVCMKIIKNSKDFFDQSLDEIKLLKYINKHDPADKYHILRLYDYFYHREHLFIVCELLRANLYEFHKYNRDSGGEVYFTMPRLQSIARQCLEALEFLHNLGLIHCDLKPENILVKSYSRCEVKVIDLGSSCFQSDHLCSYVQSRSYRAPEVILGLPYDQKIDIWSLGCILAELCSGNVLFQNDSLATLLARVVGIIGPLDPEMVAKGRDSFKYLTRNNMLYDRNQETNRVEYLIPKKTTLAHRLPMGDQGFVDFVRYLLQINPKNRPTASEALKHAWLSFPYEPISS